MRADDSAPGVEMTAAVNIVKPYVLAFGAVGR